MLRGEIVSKVRVASRIKAIRTYEPRPSLPVFALASTPMSVAPVSGRTVSLVVIGASTGGPLAVRELLAELPADFPAAIIVVQHMPALFTSIFASQLNKQLPLDVKEAENGDLLRPNRVFIAPGDQHLFIEGAQIRLVRGPAIRGFRPSIDVAMQSAAQQLGPQVCGIVLTGMGEDGAIGSVAIRARGGRTLVQDELSCAVNGMPQAARDRGGIEAVDHPRGLALRLCAMLSNTY